MDRRAKTRQGKQPPPVAKPRGRLSHMQTGHDRHEKGADSVAAVCPCGANVRLARAESRCLLRRKMPVRWPASTVGALAAPARVARYGLESPTAGRLACTKALRTSRRDAKTALAR